MVDTKVSALPATVKLDGSELVPVVKAGVSTQVPAALLAKSAAESSRTALARFQALAQYRNTKPVYVVCCGDSWTFGTGSSGGNNNWIGRLHARLANYFFLDSGQTQGAVAYVNNPGAGGNGIRIVGNGHSGATTATYLPAQEIIDLLKMQPAMVIHAIGLNDQAQSFTKATYKANLSAAVNAIRAQSTAPVVQFLVRNPELKRSTQAYPWSDYGDAMLEIVATSPGDLAYVDLTPSFEQAQIRSNDPLALMQTDGGHPNDAGHAFIAELLFGAIRSSLTLGLAPTPSPSLDLPANYATAVPTISGTTTVGQTLTASTGSWTATPDSYTYQWRRAGVDISSATSATYLLAAADAGNAISVAVSSVKSGYASRTAVSAASASVAASGSSSFTTTGTPTISGTPTVGQTLTANPGTWAPTPDSYTYQWNRAGSAISGATGSTYALVSADTNQTLTVTVTAVKSGYTSASATSASVSVSAAGSASFTSAGTPTITGTPTVGQTLTAVPGTWTPAADSYLYQWNRAGTAISGATAATYVLVSADVGSVTVTVTGVKSGYNNLAATSAAVTVAAAAGGSTQFADTFTGNDGDPWSSSLWTKRAGNGTLSILNNQGKLATPATANDYVLAFATGMTASFDQEMYIEFTTPAAGFITFGISTQNFAYTAPNNGYFLQMQVGSGYQAKRSLTGTATQIDYQSTPAVVANTAYRLRFKRSNSASNTPTIQYRTWLATDSAEPSTWKMTYTDSTPPTIAGQVWVLLTNNATAVAQSATVDNITVV